jgi:hypothetical protein
LDDELGVQWRPSRFCSSMFHPCFIHFSSFFHPIFIHFSSILRESRGSQEFHRTGGFDGAWPMTLAPELAKLKGCWDSDGGQKCGEKMVKTCG